MINRFTRSLQLFSVNVSPKQIVILVLVRGDSGSRNPENKWKCDVMVVWFGFLMAAAVWLAMWQNSGLLGTPGYKKYLKKKLLKHLHIFYKYIYASQRSYFSKINLYFVLLHLSPITTKLLYLKCHIFFLSEYIQWLIFVHGIVR